MNLLECSKNLQVLVDDLSLLAPGVEVLRQALVHEVQSQRIAERERCLDGRQPVLMKSISPLDIILPWVRCAPTANLR